MDRGHSFVGTPPCARCLGFSSWAASRTCLTLWGGVLRRRRHRGGDGDGGGVRAQRHVPIRRRVVRDGGGEHQHSRVDHLSRWWGRSCWGARWRGALLLVLFQTAHFVETRLTGHARGDLRSLWATVPGEANVVDLNPDGSPDVATERLVPAREVAVGTNVFVKAGQQVRFFSAARQARPTRVSRRDQPGPIADDEISQNLPRGD